MVDFEGDTELTLGLPGGIGRREREAPSPEAGFSGGHKRGFVETGVDCSDSVDFDPLSSNGKSSVVDHVDNKLELSTEATSQAPSIKAQVIGWPPVRSFRKKVLADSCHDGKYVKVAADGAPYLRKVDLETFSSYQELFRALKDMFFCFNILSGNCDQKYGKFFQVKGMVGFVPTYEDKDGDWMLVGDVPWKMFTESCERIRLMKSTEAVGLAPRTEDA